MSEMISAKYFQECSEAIDDGAKGLEVLGVDFRSDKAVQMATLAIKAYLPDIVQWQQEVIRVEANSCWVVDGQQGRRFSDVEFGGTLATISLQQLHTEDHIETVSFTDIRYDLCALVLPRFLDPDPVDLVFGEEILVPFADISMMRRDGSRGI